LWAAMFSKSYVVPPEKDRENVTKLVGEISDERSVWRLPSAPYMRGVVRTGICVGASANPVSRSTLDIAACRSAEVMPPDT